MSTLTTQLNWSCHIPDALCLEGEREGTQIFVADRHKHLHSLDVNGHLTTAISLPHSFVSVEVNRHHKYGMVFLGNTDNRVYLTDCKGHVLWRYPKWLPKLGINEAHWGDINGDGHDEIVLGVNGSGGLLAFTSEGTPLWKVKNVKNVWSHTILPSTSFQRSLLLATEASGRIHLYRGQGQLVRTFCPGGEYFTNIAASVVDLKAHVQVAAMALREQDLYEVIICDLTGKILYRTPTSRQLMKRAFVCEDINGDGVKEWGFIRNTAEFVFLSSCGEILTTLEGQDALDDFLLLPQPDGWGIFLTLQAGTIRAYSFHE